MSAYRLPARASLLLASLLSFNTAFAAPAKAVPGDIVDLPEFRITEGRVLPREESWRYGTMPGFEILSNATDDRTAALLRDFQVFTYAVGLVWKTPPRTATTPITLIVCGADNRFDAFKPVNPQVGEHESTSLLYFDRERAALVLDFQKKVVRIHQIQAHDDGDDRTRIEVEHDKQLYREYARFLLGQSSPRPAAWVEEGIAQLIMHMKISPTRVQVGVIEERGTLAPGEDSLAERQLVTAGSDAEGRPQARTLRTLQDKDFNSVLAKRKLMSFEEFFAVRHTDPEANHPMGNNVWAKQASAFVHLCLYGKNKQFQMPFMMLAERATREPVTETVFKECFKLSYKQMEMELRLYIDAPVFEMQEFRAKDKKHGLPEPTTVAFREATQSEIGRIKGDALDLAGKPELAREELLTAYRRGEREPRFLAAVGVFEMTHGREDNARKFLDAAVKAQVDRPRAYLELARLRLRDARASQPRGARLTTAQANAIVDPLRTGVMIPPASPALYHLAADTWDATGAQPPAADVTLLIRGAALYPTDLGLVYQAANYAEKAGLLKETRVLASHGMKLAKEPSGQALFKAMLDRLPPPTQAKS